MPSMHVWQEHHSDRPQAFLSRTPLVLIRGVPKSPLLFLSRARLTHLPREIQLEVLQPSFLVVLLTVERLAIGFAPALGHLRGRHSKDKQKAKHHDKERENAEQPRPSVTPTRLLKTHSEKYFYMINYLCTAQRRIPLYRAPQLSSCRFLTAEAAPCAHRGKNIWPTWSTAVSTEPSLPATPPALPREPPRRGAVVRLPPSSRKRFSRPPWSCRAVPSARPDICDPCVTAVI